jgi:hypothetical protein
MKSIPAPSPPTVQAISAEMDLLGLGGSAPPPAASPAGLILKHMVKMTGDEYQSHWGSISDTEATVTAVPVASVPSSTDEVENRLGSIGVRTMASGELPTEFKFFLYAQDEVSDGLFLIQSNLSKGGEPLLILTIKTNGGIDAPKVEQLVELIRLALA